MIQKHQISSPKDVFFDPWIEPRYYYSILPILPLIYDRVFIYYPSDHWLSTEQTLTPTNLEWYKYHFIHWIKKGVLIPVVQGNYPFQDHISKTRRENDGPTESFEAELRTARREAERLNYPGRTWIQLPIGATERGRVNAKSIIRNVGNIDDLTRALKFSPNPEAIPDLAYYYAGGLSAKSGRALIETIGTYENDDWIRDEHDVGEYLLPGLLAYQYRALQSIKQQHEDIAIYHELALAMAVDRHLENNRIRSGFDWMDPEKVNRWREGGLHHVLRQYLLSDVLKVQIFGQPQMSYSDKAFEITKRFEDLQDTLPIELAEFFVDSKWILEIVGGASGLIAGSVGGIPGMVVGAAGGVLAGWIGKKAVNMLPVKFRWDQFLDVVAHFLGKTTSNKLAAYTVAFEDVRVLGSTQ